MGIPNFLSQILNHAGREIDLRDYSDRKEPLRIAIDVSPWIHRACFTFSDILADEKHLTNYGRSTLLLHNINNNYEGQKRDHPVHIEEQEEGSRPTTALTQREKDVLEFVAKSCRTVIDNLLSLQKASKAELLIVFDGATPPIKLSTVVDRGAARRTEQQYRDLPVDTTAQSPLLERRLKANRRSGAGEHYASVINAIILALRCEQIPFLVAPYEADSQLAFLSINKYVDLIITEDSDLIVYGLACPLMYRLSRNAQGEFSRGVLLRRTDISARVLGTNHPKSSIDLTDFTPPMLACLFAAVGCDYCSKLRGVGLSLACREVRAAFFPKHDWLHGNRSNSPLERLIQSLFKSTWDRNKLTDDDKDIFERDFLAAVFMYRHATIFDPVHICCRSMIPLHHADPELTSYGPYAAIIRNKIRVASITGQTFPSNIASYVAEGWICPKTLRPRNSNHNINGDDLPEHIRNDLNHYLENKATLDRKEMEVDHLRIPVVLSPNCKEVREVRRPCEGTL